MRLPAEYCAAPFERPPMEAEGSTHRLEVVELGLVRLELGEEGVLGAAAGILLVGATGGRRGGERVSDPTRCGRARPEGAE